MRRTEFIPMDPTKIPENKESRLLIVKRILETTAAQLFRLLRGRVALDILVSLGAAAVLDVLRRWDGRGRLGAFAAQRIRWTILREVRREALRAQRAGLCAETRADLLGEKRCRGAMLACAPDDEATCEDAGDEPRDMADAPGAMQHFESHILRLEMRNAIGRLPPASGQLIYHYYYLGETVSEIARQLGVSKSTVSERLTLATRSLRALIDADGSLK